MLPELERGLVGNFVKMHVLPAGLWGGDHAPEFLTRSQVMPVLLVHGPHLEQKGCLLRRRLLPTCSL